MTKISYSGYRFPPEIIDQAIWLYLRFTLSFRDVEDLLAERGIAVSYETVRRWVNHFGPMIGAHLRKRRPKPHTVWHLDEVYLKIDGRMVYLWRAVDAEGEVRLPITNSPSTPAGFIDGTSLFGGMGTAIGAVIGALLLESLNNGMGLMNIELSFEQIVDGLVLLVAVYLDMRNGRGGV